MASSTLAGRTDQQIQQDVLDELAWDSSVHPNEIGVIVKDGVVTLTGTVDSFFKRQSAEGAARRVRGVKAVADDIDVRLPSATERTDAELASACLYALTWDAAIPTADLDVTVSKGRVTLKGEVDWHYEREAAERVVRRLAGVTWVTNLLTIKTRAAPADIKERIERALIRNAAIDAHRITVEVQGGTAILRGGVGSYAERRTAERSAWAAPGISAVENQISVELQD